MRIGIVQYGIYHDSFLAFRQNGQETYYAQRYSVDFVETLSRKHDFVGVCGVLGAEPAEVALTQTLYSACIPAVHGAVDAPATIGLLEKWRLDRLILQAPVRPILRWALKNGVNTLPLLADSFEMTSLRARYRAFMLARLLNSPNIQAVGNHNIPASLSLKRIGVATEKIFPWDWPHELRPEDYPVKLLGDSAPSLVFVGALATAKGVEDCIRAARILCDDNVDFRMTLIGAGSYDDGARRLIKELNLMDCVAIPGRLGHDEVVDCLRAATISMVPSHHLYPEGLPMTIYEALATRTPLVVSDHPMFRMYFKDTPAVQMTAEKDPAALAMAIRTLLEDRQAYAAASEATEALWNRVKCDLSWDALIGAWLDDDSDGLARIRHFALNRQLDDMK